MTGESSRNWVCGCKPGILGPPVSPIPALLRSTIEQLAHGPPLSWKLSFDNNLTKLAMKWTMNIEQPTNRTMLIPAAVLTALSSLNSAPASWSLEQDDHLLQCSLSLGTLHHMILSHPLPQTPPTPAIPHRHRWQHLLAHLLPRQSLSTSMPRWTQVNRHPVPNKPGIPPLLPSTPRIF